MKELLEKSYEEFSSIVSGSWTRGMKMAALEDLYDRLGNDSAAFDNMVYERLGMSAEEALDMIDSGDTLP